jgi:very-short-patch-repair endonuclease
VAGDEVVGALRSRSALEEAFAIEAKHAGLPTPKRQHRFCERRWLFDFAWPEQMVAVEIDGGTWSRGRHTRPQGFQNDCEKLNRAVLDGWRVLRFTGDDVKSGEAVNKTREVLNLYASDL